MPRSRQRFRNWKCPLTWAAQVNGLQGGGQGGCVCPGEGRAGSGLGSWSPWATSAFALLLWVRDAAKDENACLCLCVCLAFSLPFLLSFFLATFRGTKTCLSPSLSLSLSFLLSPVVLSLLAPFILPRYLLVWLGSSGRWPKR